MIEKKFDLGEEDKERIQSLIYMFMWQIQAERKQQTTELINTFSALIKYLNQEENYSQQISLIEYRPISFVRKIKNDVFTDDEFKNIDENYCLSELDFIYFRDTSLAYRLKKKYRSTHTKRRNYRKTISLSQIVIVLSFVRKWVFSEFLDLIKKHNLVIPQIQLPATNLHNLNNVGIQKGGGLK